jgi:hypothetical protein
MSEHLLRVYFDPAEIGLDGYPYAWHKIPEPGVVVANDPSMIRLGVKDLIRMQAGNRCERCHHSYEVGKMGSGEWTPCDEQCTHGGVIRINGSQPFDATNLAAQLTDELGYEVAHEAQAQAVIRGRLVEAQWRILTVHHLNRIKHDLRWWNLCALCQRCHLTIQSKVYLERPWYREHTEWFKPHAAAWYAWSFLGLELSREETLERMEELLALEHRQLAL